MRVRTITDPVRQGIKLLSNPDVEFGNIYQKSFETIVGEYTILLILASIAAGLLSFIWAVSKAGYYDLFQSIDVQYLRMINYSLGRLTSIIFFYLFFGTFAVFFVSVILKPFFRKIKYINLLSILMCSLSPVLIFGWIFVPPYAFLIWSLFLFVKGVRNYKHISIKKDSINMRE